jgi:ribosome-binding protein aMBF1 (putative translation factor)
MRTVLSAGHAPDAPEAKMANKNRKASLEIRWRLSSNVRSLREARGYTQEDLARLCQLNKNYVSNVEQATVNITLANLEALAKGLGCTEEELLKRHPGP